MGSPAVTETAEPLRDDSAGRRALQPREPRPARRGRATGRAGPVAYALLALALVVSAFPFYWSFVVASNDSSVMNQVPPAVLPGGDFLENARMVFDRVPFHRSIVNSFIVSGVSTVSVVFFSTLAGFAFAKIRFRGREVLFLVVLATMLLPVQLGIIPLYMLMAEIGWLNSLRAVIVPGMVTAFGVFWMRQFVSGAVHDELLDAGRSDGCSTIRLFWHVVAPAVRPAAAVLALLTFMQTWNEFLWALVALREPEVHTVQIAMRQLNDAYYQDYGMVMAATIIGTIPVVALIAMFGRRVIGNLMEGAVKG